METTLKFKFGSTEREIDELAEKVKSGIKVSTSSLFDYYSLGIKKLSTIGEYASILNSCNREIARVRIVKIEIVKYKDISESFAIEEGDGNLQNWREIHEKYYSNQLSEIGKTLNDNTELVCEWFILI